MNYSFLIEHILKKKQINRIYHLNFKEAICFLSLGINLMKHSYSFFKSPETFILFGKIFLTLSFLLLGYNQYESAEKTLSISVKFFYISLESILYLSSNNISYSIFNILQQDENIYNIISKIIFYLSLSFYHLGVCYENQGFIYYSFYAYKQSKYFSSIIKDQNLSYERFYNFIKEIEERVLMRNRLFIFFVKFGKKENLIDKVPSKKKVNDLFSFHKKQKRFIILENLISKMNLIDVDNDEPHLFDKINKHFKYNVNLATKQIHLLDYLMGDKFKEIIKNIDDIKINKIDKETKNIIQKNIIKIKNDEKEKLRLIKDKKMKINKSISAGKISKKPKLSNYKNKTIKTISSVKTFNYSGKQTKASSSYKNINILMTDINNNKSIKTESCFTYNSRPITAHNELSSKSSFAGYFSLKNLSNKNKILLNQNNKNEKVLKFNNNKIKISKSAKNIKRKHLKYIVPTYSYDKYLFDKSFMNKKKYLENQYAKELIFQKQLLYSKKHDLIEPKVFNLKEVQNNCDKFYFSTFERELMNVNERNIIFGKKEINSNNIKTKTKKNNTFLKKIKTKDISNELINDKSEYNFHNINKINFESLDKLFGDIIYLNDKENNIRKKFIK